MWRPRRIAFGLGNPGPEYAGTRHNAGFEVVDLVARERGLLFRSAKSLDGYRGPRALSCAQSEEPSYLLVKPETFMNRSGDAVAALASWAQLPPTSLLVVYDDLDLDLGHLRLRPHGGHGGHNGMRSILDSLGSNAFPRLRVGIGRGSTDAVRHVLSRFQADERAQIDVSYAQAAEALCAWLDGGDLEELMTRFQSRWS